MRALAPWLQGKLLARIARHLARLPPGEMVTDQPLQGHHRRVMAPLLVQQAPFLELGAVGQCQPGQERPAVQRHSLGQCARLVGSFRGQRLPGIGGLECRVKGVDVGPDLVRLEA